MLSRNDDFKALPRAERSQMGQRLSIEQMQCFGSSSYRGFDTVLKPGCSVSIGSYGNGTLTLWLAPEGNQEVYGLTCGHVLEHDTEKAVCAPSWHDDSMMELVQKHTKIYPSNLPEVPAFSANFIGSRTHLRHEVENEHLYDWALFQVQSDSRRLSDQVDVDFKEDTPEVQHKLYRLMRGMEASKLGSITGASVGLLAEYPTQIIFLTCQHSHASSCLETMLSKRSAQMGFGRGCLPSKA